MTRVTIWEAKRSLQIGNDMSHIQWTEATRNGTGGIDLIGLHRAAPELDASGNLISQTVRAQRYVIQTDMWGRILSTLVRDVRVPPFGLHSSLLQTETVSGGTDTPPNYSTISPEPPLGDDLAQRFFPVPQTPPSPSTSQPLTTQAIAEPQPQEAQAQVDVMTLESEPRPMIHSQPVQRQMTRDPTATPYESQIPAGRPIPSPYPRINEQRRVETPSGSFQPSNARDSESLIREPIPRSREQSELRKLHCELVYKIDECFNISELKELYFLLKIEYENIEGGDIRKNKCIELVSYCVRHNVLWN